MNLHSAFWKSLFSVSDALRERSETLKDQRTDWDLTIQQLRLLLVVERLTRTEYPEGIMLKTLANVTGVTPAAVSGMVESMVRKKYLDRVPSATDRRAVRIRLSGECLKKFHPYEQLFNGLAGDVEQKIGKKRFERLTEDLRFIAETCRDILPDLH